MTWEKFYWSVHSSNTRGRDGVMGVGNGHFNLREQNLVYDPSNNI